jgi:hypothetical protein
VTRTYVGTQAPGDLWTWSILPGGTWNATNDTLGFMYAGTWATLPSGFVKLTIATSTDPGTAAGDAAYALEVPDSVLVVMPAGADENLILAARTGTCAAGPSLALNYVQMTDSGFDELTDEAYGVAAVTIAGSTWSGTGASYLLDGTSLGSSPLPSLTCSLGLVTNPLDPSDVSVYAPTGVLISDSGPGMGGVMGMDAPATNVDLSDVLALGREYRAFSYQDESLTGQDNRPHWARPNGTGGLAGGDYVDIETNVEDMATSATLLFTSQPLPGVVNGTLTDGAGTSPIVFMINRIAGRYFLFGVSVNTSDGLPYNFIALEQ